MSLDYQCEETLLLNPEQVKPTYVFSESSAPGEIEKRDKKVAELEELVASKPNCPIELVAIRDPETADLLVYTGNIQHAYASAERLKLRVGIITNQKELDEYSQKTGEVSVLGVTNFSELISDLRVAAKYPAVERDMPKDDFKKMLAKQKTWQRKKADAINAGLAQLAGWDDDEDS